MRRVTRLRASLFGLLAVAALSGCGSGDDAEAEAGLAGTWVDDELAPSILEVWILKGDGTGESTSSSEQIGDVTNLTRAIAWSETSASEMDATLTCSSFVVFKADGTTEDLTCQGFDPLSYRCELESADRLACTCTSCPSASVRTFDRG